MKCEMMIIGFCFAPCGLFLELMGISSRIWTIAEEEILEIPNEVEGWWEVHGFTGNNTIRVFYKFKSRDFSFIEAYME